MGDSLSYLDDLLISTVCNCDDQKSLPRETFRYNSVSDVPANQHDSGSGQGGKSLGLDCAAIKVVNCPTLRAARHNCYLHNRITKTCNLLSCLLTFFAISIG